MSYERQAIADESAIPSQPAPQMREERVFNPYRANSSPALGVDPPTSPEPIGQSDTQRVSPAEDTAKTEETVKLSPQVAAIARREQRFRQQQQELEKEKAELAAQKAEIEQLRAMKQKLAAKDYSGLEGLVDYNDYSQYQLNKINGSDPVKEELTKLQTKVTEIEKKAQDNLEKQYQAAVEERRIAAKTLVDSSDQFPRIKKAQATEAVVQHILDTWEHDSKELSIDQAAKEVEEILIERAKAWAALLEDEKEVDPPPVSETQKKPLPSLKSGLTLTNDMTSLETKRPVKPYQQMSDHERWAEARRRALAKLQPQG